MIFQVTQQGLHESEIHPRHVHANLCRHLLQERDEWWPTQGLSKSMKVFHQEVESLDTPCIFLPPDDFTQDVLNKQVPDEKMCNVDISKTHPLASDVCPTKQSPLPRPGCGGDDRAEKTDQTGLPACTHDIAGPHNLSLDNDSAHPLPRPGGGNR